MNIIIKVKNECFTIPKENHFNYYLTVHALYEKPQHLKIWIEYAIIKFWYSSKNMYTYKINLSSGAWSHKGSNQGNVIECGSRVVDIFVLSFLSFSCFCWCFFSSLLSGSVHLNILCLKPYVSLCLSNNLFFSKKDQWTGAGWQKFTIRIVTFFLWHPFLRQFWIIPLIRAKLVHCWGKLRHMLLRIDLW